MHDLGLALSGGGSRAAAFHCGTLSALRELGLTDKIGVVSTVSGGSLFGAAWMAARARGAADDTFVDAMKCALEAGFLKKVLGLWRRKKINLLSELHACPRPSGGLRQRFAWRLDPWRTARSPRALCQCHHSQ